MVKTMVFKEIYQSDKTRYGTSAGGGTLCFLYYFRKSQTCDHPVLKYWYRFIFSRLKNKRGIELSRTTSIGKGLYLGHAYNITINPKASIGENCNIHKGVTIGQENRGVRKGTPKIGSQVWIGTNAAIVGNITVGDDVLIAPNSYVNCDVPDHSVVFGNPCIIKHRENATEDYINNLA